MIVGVLTEDSGENLRAFASEKKMNYPLVMMKPEFEDCVRSDLRSADVGAHRARRIGVQTPFRPDVEGAARTGDQVAPVVQSPQMLKGFTHARLACGCRIGFREGVEGSPVTVVVEQKAPGCLLTLHVRDLPLFDHREALRTPTRLLPPIEEDYEESRRLSEL